MLGGGCRELGPGGQGCGEGRWGNIPVEEVDFFVDRASDEAAPGGKPLYRTIREALAAAPAGSTIGVAAGEYAVGLYIPRSVRIIGRCPRLVSVTGSVGNDESKSTVLVSDCGDVSLIGLRISGPGYGVLLVNAQGVEVSGCAIQGNEGKGILAAQAEVSIAWSAAAVGLIGRGEAVAPARQRPRRGARGRTARI